jgi:hypothetical protein
MRFIPINKLLREIARTEGGARKIKRLHNAHKRLIRMSWVERKRFLARNGAKKWSPMKDELTALVGNKCWYTELAMLGAPLTIDHFRPQKHYWFLALEPSNFRIACSYSNSLYHNPLYGCAGGKGDEFPLLGHDGRAKGKSKLRRETPVLLDPCNADDCKLIVFQETGRPIVNPRFRADPHSVQRVQQSLILFNIDHPDFNTQREQLYFDIRDDIKMYNELPAGADSRLTITQRMERRINPRASFSVAAKQYLQRYRNLDWVEAILNGVQD